MLRRIISLLKELRTTKDKKEYCKVNGELAQAYSEIFDVEVEKVAKALLSDEKFIDRLKEKVGWGLGRRSLIEALLAGAGVGIGISGLAKANPVIGSDGLVVNNTYYFPQIIPASAIVYKDGRGNVIARDMFGKVIAKGVDGVDDTSMIQSSLDQKGHIVVQKAEYLVSSPLILYSDTIIDFQNSTLKATADVGALAMLYAQDVDNIIIKNVVLDANNKARRTLMVKAINKNIYNVVLENVETKNTITGYIWSGLNIGAEYGHSVNKVRLRNIYIHNHPETVHDNVSLGRCFDLVVENCRFEDLGKNVLLYGGSYHKFINCHFENVPIFNVQSIYSKICENTLINSSLFVRPFDADGSPDARDTYNVKIISNTIINGGIDIQKATNDVHDIDIIRNTIKFDPYDTSDKNCIFLNTVYNIECHGNRLVGAGRSGIYLYNVHDSRFFGNRAIDNGNNTGLAVRGGLIDFDASYPSYNLELKNNWFKGITITQVYGIFIRGDNNILEGNDVSGCSTPIRLDGTGNVVKSNKDYPTENSGLASITADGVATQFTIPHGLVATPNYVNVIPKAGAPTPSSIDADATNIILTFATAPTAGTYYYWWEAKV